MRVASSGSPLPKQEGRWGESSFAWQVVKYALKQIISVLYSRRDIIFQTSFINNFSINRRATAKIW